MPLLAHMLSTLLVLLLGLFQVPVQAASPSPGSISGTLVTYDLKPAAGYLVYIAGTSSSSTFRTQVKTDEAGVFKAKGLNLGDYILAPYIEPAINTISRYPGGTGGFYISHPNRVQLTETSPRKVVALRLEPPNRILTGKITSRATGAPVTTTIRIEFSKDPYRWVRFSSAQDGSYRILIPPNTELKMTLSAPGYQSLTHTIGPVPENVDPQIDLQMVLVLSSVMK